jgi:hypothetical protein
LLPAFSLSKRWNVAKLTSAISSSPSVIACEGEKFNFCGVSVAGTADAEALPASEKVNPAAPRAGTAAFATLLRFEACFTRDIVASSILWERFRFQPRQSYDACVFHARLLIVTNMLFRIQFLFILMNDNSVTFARKNRVAIASKRGARAVRMRRCSMSA